MHVGVGGGLATFQNLSEPRHDLSDTGTCSCPRTQCPPRSRLPSSSRPEGTQSHSVEETGPVSKPDGGAWPTGIQGAGRETTFVGTVIMTKLRTSGLVAVQLCSWRSLAIAEASWLLQLAEPK
ncbi:Hypothetical predicted protein [Marmota monax]|uniref:Uncharacterized protein n=1 Tax=Marmota monax TaxID=9995 RepID=A0A5E4A7Z9_MARMO|nr:Hypothetical predicted protein [Marmota monax]